MKLDRIASFLPSLAAACCAFVSVASFGGCVITPDDVCERHPEDPSCSYAIDKYRDHKGKGGNGNNGSNAGTGGCAGAAGAAARPGTGGTSVGGRGGAVVAGV